MIYKKVVSFDLDKTIERRPIKELYQSFEEIKSSEDVILTEEFIADVIAYGFPFTRNMMRKAMVDPGKLAAFGCFLKDLFFSSVGSITEMIQIPASTFKMGGTDYRDEQPVREVTVSGYSIGKYPVTNREYKMYLEDTNREVPAAVSDPEKANHPIAGVSWFDAVEYCNWLSKKQGLEPAYTIKRNRAGEIIKVILSKNLIEKGYHLPTEAQWELAARGTDGRKYPWGNDFDPSKFTSSVNGKREGTEPVDAHPEGTTPEGVMGMAGNVWEWVADFYWLYNFKDINNPKGPRTGEDRVLRGGSWFDFKTNPFRGAYRGYDKPKRCFKAFGFRVAKG
ncbi:hypothetical protein A2526_01030 [candidate division WOR-1 bacterium RIFOXYD2_FULL_36_8]|uniref:Sulfatase-modifying factor enzyme-like domain-containing protein n=1 Tax=candidate division WOR-1 bacterium RIFOXYB2_FULL_36_35 TaxID=1802578 RepID=A0A1F4S2Y8_UNCSA|nr:MAG: hypothetical protein A2230_07650 [candidate division WOR-1 bacterium RIFOXYA2_FULL_36_21]OGC14739.1 MAG: hypothetical protein A2290_08595 [candidate division WOR-1 bacterium RIFOXYB2_FULL_36_35]OGC15477.1 MAG: hypothetical protein A2282_07825 [candidate division WOR-1 bacterium RIFOXYA12_FULL_36_13]OGC38040.1 MAG: hypothetical protein A2526_01030 [candidate division WOR-1 bacterium RIFOXYD2_FULL_36_8]